MQSSPPSTHHPGSDWRQFALWRGPLGLLLIGLVSVALAALYANEFINASAENANQLPAHYRETPIPILVHILVGTLLVLLIPVQFAVVIRQRWPRFHRATGRVLAVCVLFMGMTSLWMNTFYPAFGGTAKYLGVLMHVIVLVGGLAWALVAIRQGQVKQHRLGMMCMTAATLSPAVQRIIAIPLYVLLGHFSDWMIGLLVWLGLLVNLAFVAWIASRKTTFPVYLENN